MINPVKTERIGETRTMNNGINATIICYRNNKDIDVQFENGCIAKNIVYRLFAKGIVKCPLIIEYYDNFCKVTNVNTKHKTEFLIDVEDVSKIQNKMCSINDSGYIMCNKKRLHREIMNCSQDVEIDHINGNRLDNRKTNLRICTRQQNAYNLSKRITNRSGYKGVSLCGFTNKWKSVIGFEKRTITIGRYNTKELAAEAYNKKALELYGDFARLNEVNYAT